VLQKFLCKGVYSIYLTISKFPTQNTIKATDYQYNQIFQSLKLWQSVAMHRQDIKKLEASRLRAF